MSVFRQLREILSEANDGPDLSLAQWRALSRQVPLMYIMVVCNSLTIAWTHYQVAPIGLSVYVPAILIALCVLRTTLWWMHRDAEVGEAVARRGVVAMIVMGLVLGAAFVAWGIALFQYGDISSQMQVAAFMALTAVGCVFCLMHVRAAAMVIGLTVLAPFAVYFNNQGNPSLTAVAINFAMVLGAAAFIIHVNHKNFAALVASRNAMAQRQVETQELLEENHRLATLDSLTGVPNRRYFDQQLGKALAEVERRGGTIAVARIDIDSFKSVNQIFGQITGDQVLAEVALRLGKAKRASNILARLDGDNFALIMQEPNDRSALEACGVVVRKAVRESFHTSLGIVRITASVGVAVSQPGDTPEALFDRADYATWVAKRDARGEMVIFTDQHARDLTKVRRMEHLLHTVDLDEEIYIVVQPQYDVALRETTGFEVLARWRSPVLGEVSPGDFIPMAERTGQISRITQTVLRKALAVSEQLPRTLRLSVNLSANDIGSPTAIEQIVALVGNHPKPSRIDFEITETSVMRDLKQANQSLLSLLGLGARIALDDFGTGHSSLTHVQKLPLHRIKIDRSFVMEVTSDPASRAIVKTMVDLCRNLGISCVFEGIETEEQLEALVSLGGRVMQGYLFGRPMAPEMIESYLGREQALRHFESRAASA